MTTNIEFKRTHDGRLEMFVSGVPALSARVNGINMIGDELFAVVVVPLKESTIGERTNVLPFGRAA